MVIEDDNFDQHFGITFKIGMTKQEKMKKFKAEENLPFFDAKGFNDLYF